jgi:multidrug resistance efflux pump
LKSSMVIPASMAAALAVAALATLLPGCGDGDKPAAAAAAPLAVPLETVRKREMPLTYEAAGTVRSTAVTAIASKILGEIKALPAREGDRVKAGQLLAEIDSRDAAAAQARAEAGLKEAQSAIEETANAIRSAEASRTAADASAALASGNLKRYQELLKAGAANRQEFEEVETKQKLAAAEAERAAQNLSAAESRRKQVQAKMEQAKAELEAARVNLGYAKITAPFDALVTARSAEVGDMAAPGKTLLTIENPGRYRLEAELGEAQAAGLKPGDDAFVRVDALGGKDIPAKVAEIVPVSAAGSRSFTVKVDLPAAEGLSTGLFGRAFFVRGKTEVLAAPAAAVVDRGQLTGVFVVGADGAARWRLVKTGRRCPQCVEVLSGLDAGETVVAGGLEKVADGVVVKR